MTTVTNAQLKTLLETQATKTNNNFKKAKKSLDDKVDKVSGKDLSTNDFTDALQTKLNALPTNAQLQSGYVAKDGSKVLSDNNYTTAEKQKLAGLSNYDDASIQSAIAEKTTMSAVEAKGYQTAQNVTDTINTILGSISITAWDDININE